MQYKIENNIKHEWKLLLQNNTKLNNLNAINNFLIASRRSEKNIRSELEQIQCQLCCGVQCKILGRGHLRNEQNINPNIERTNEVQRKHGSL